MAKWTRNNRLLISALKRVGIHVEESVVEIWSDSEAVDAEVWALATHLSHPEIPPGNPPEHLTAYIQQD